SDLMGVPSLPYLVTTRIIAGSVAIVPLYGIGLLSSYLASRQVTLWFNGQSAGTYDHYFNIFLAPEDVVLSFVKVLIFSVMVVLAHCYYGYRAVGGPAGVGVAVGRAGRTAIVLISVTDFFISLAIWGATTTVKVTGWHAEGGGLTWRDAVRCTWPGSGWRDWCSCWSRRC